MRYRYSCSECRLIYRYDFNSVFLGGGGANSAGFRLKSANTAFHSSRTMRIVKTSARRGASNRRGTQSNVCKAQVYSTCPPRCVYRLLEAHTDAWEERRNGPVTWKPNRANDHRSVHEYFNSWSKTAFAADSKTIPIFLKYSRCTISFAHADIYGEIRLYATRIDYSLQTHFTRRNNPDKAITDERRWLMYTSMNFACRLPIRRIWNGRYIGLFWVWQWPQLFDSCTLGISVKRMWSAAKLAETVICIATSNFEAERNDHILFLWLLVC